MSVVVSVFIWLAVAAAMIVPVFAASLSPLLQWRTPIYIAAGFAGIGALCLMLLQPLMAATLLPGLSAMRSRKLHRFVGGALAGLVVVHVVGLWITSPPDVIDALLFASPTPFSVWGVVAMWCVFASAVLAALRSKFRLRMHVWKNIHKVLAAVTVVGTVVHALKIEGAMQSATKVMLCVLVLAVSAWVLTGMSARVQEHFRKRQ